MSRIEPVRSAGGFQTAFTRIPVWTVSGSTSPSLCMIPIPGEAPSRSITAGMSGSVSSRMSHVM